MLPTSSSWWWSSSSPSVLAGTIYRCGWNLYFTKPVSHFMKLQGSLGRVGNSVTLLDFMDDPAFETETGSSSSSSESENLSQRRLQIGAWSKEWHDVMLKHSILHSLASLANAQSWSEGGLITKSVATKRRIPIWDRSHVDGREMHGASFISIKTTPHSRQLKHQDLEHVQGHLSSALTRYIRTLGIVFDSPIPTRDDPNIE